LKPLWFIDLLKKNFKHRFTLAGLTRLPLIGSMMDHALFAGDALVILPKDAVIQVEVNQALEPPTNTVLPSQVVHTLIDQAGYHFAMDFCLCRESNQCEDYPRDLGCLFMGEAAKRIDPRLGHPITREEAHAHARRARDAGLVHLVGRNKLDAVWLDVSPGERLLTVCNCCPCCCLWKMLPGLSPVIGGKVTRMEGVEVTVTGDCVGCGACLDACFLEAIELEDGEAHITGECRGCGRCVEACPRGAIRITVPGLSDIDDTVKAVRKIVEVD